MSVNPECPCLRCGHATPTETVQIPVYDLEIQKPSMALRCDWSPSEAHARWFVVGMRLCELAKPDPCDAWTPGGDWTPDQPQNQGHRP